MSDTNESYRRYFLEPHARERSFGQELFGLLPTIGWDELMYAAHGVNTVLRNSWHSKFDDQFGKEAIDEKLPTLAELRSKISQPSREGRYWLAQPKRGSMASFPCSRATVMLRVETYNPRSPFKAGYPNITDLETIDGSLQGRFGRAAAGLIYLSLGDHDPDAIVSAYGEEPNQGGIAFYESLGIVIDSAYQSKPERIGATDMQYVHMVGKSVKAVRSAAQNQYELAISDLGTS